MSLLTAFTTSKEVFDMAKEVKDSYPKIIKFFNRNFRKNIRVLVVGESGTGKSQFLSTIHGKKEFVADSTMVSYSSKLELPNGRIVEFIDTPGQQSLMQDRKRRINAINRKGYDGIINLVCYGYQATEETNPSIVFQGGQIKDSYLKENREKELKQLEEWLPNIDVESNIKWVLTIVNKADVWWEQKDEVLSYYNSDKYGTKLNEILRVSTTEVIPYCSVIVPFCHRPMTLIFGEKDKYVLHCHLCDELSKLIEQEWPK